MGNFSEDDLYDGEEEDICEFCGCGPYDSPKCPACKSCGGIYSPGTEECEWCEYHDECEEDLAKKLEWEKKL